MSDKNRESFKITVAFVEMCRHSLMMLIQQRYLPETLSADWDVMFGISESPRKAGVCHVRASISKIPGHRPVRWEAYVDMEEVPRFITPLSGTMQWCAESLSRQLMESGAYREWVIEKPATHQETDKSEPARDE